MPDRNYSVDDILREMRQKQPGEIPPAGTGREEEPAPAAGRRERSAARPMWEEEEPAPRTPERSEEPRRPVRSAASRPVWEAMEEDEPAPRAGRAPERSEELRRPARPAASRPVWEAMEEDEPAPRSGRVPQREDRPRRAGKRASRSVWEELEEEEQLSRAAEESRRPRREERSASRSSWEEPEQDPPVRAGRPDEDDRRSRRAARPASRAAWEEPEEDHPRSADRRRPAGEAQRSSRASRPVWEELEDEEAPARAGRRAQRDEAPRRGERSVQPLWGEEEPAPRPGRSVAPARGQAASLWEEESPLPGGQPSAPARERSINAAAAAQMITGVSAPETDLEKRVVQKARGAAQAEDEENPRPRRRRAEQDEEDPRPRRRRMEEEEEEPRPRRRRAEEGEEEPRPRRRKEPEEDDPRTRPRIAAQLQGMKTGLIIRLVVNLLCAAGLIYLMLAPDQGWPIPEYFMDKPEQYLWLEVALLALSALVSGSTVGGGMISLFCLRPNNDCYSAVGVFACLVQGSYMAMRPEMMDGYARNLYLPMGALLLLFNTIGKLILRGRVAASYRFIAEEGASHTASLIDNVDLAGRIGGDVIDGEPEIVYFTRSAGVSSFLEQAFSESKAEDISKVIAPMTAVAAFIMAVISYPFHRDVFTSACVFTAALCITAPIAGVIATNLPIALINRRLSRWGATLCGYSAVDQFADVNGVLLRGYDLFPPESVTLHTIKPFNRTPMDEVISDIASVLSQCGSTLTQIFTKMVKSPDLLRETESFACEDGKGVSAWVEGRRVLIGNRELMKAYGVAIPPREYEDQYGQGKQILYIANSGQAAGMCVLSYKADKQMRRALELLADRDIALCVYTTDPNVTAPRITQIYNFPKELVKVIPAALHREVDRYMDPGAGAKAGMVHSGEPASYIRGVAAARSCDSTLTVQTALLLLSVVVGFALVTFFAFTGGMPALTWMTIAAYQLFWALIQLFVALFKPM